MERTGILFFTDELPAAALEAYARRIEELGADTLWLPELFGREPMATAGYLLARTERLRLATGIANVYARDAVATAAAARTLAELSGGRFSLGLGVSNVGLNTARGHTWEPPVRKLVPYLDAMEKASLASVAPDAAAPLYLAAHGPGLLRLAAARTQGALTYLMTPAHTRDARERLGPERALHVAQMALLCEEPDEARRLARRAVSIYIGLDYYHRAWRNQGFGDADFENGGSDRLIDALVAWGAPDQIAGRLREQRSAGASDLILIPLNPRKGEREPDWALLEALASLGS